MNRSRSRREKAAAASKGVSPSTWLLSVAVILAPLMTGRLEVGSEPVEPTLHGVVMALFSTGTMLSVAIWLIALLTLIAALWEWKKEAGSEDAAPRRAHVLAAFFLLWMLASVLTSVYRWGTLVMWSWWAVALAGAWLFSQRRREQAVLVVYALALAGTLTAAVAVREYAENVRLVPNWRVFGTFFNPSFLAGYLCLTLPVTLAVAMAASPSARTQTSGGREEVRWLAGFGAWLQVSALLLTGSRFGAACAVLAFIVVAGWMAWNRSWNRQRALTFSILCLLALATAFIAARPLTQRIAPQAAQAESHSGGFRVWTWKGTLNMVKRRPLLGTGLGTYEIAYPRDAYVGFTRLAHNSYLQIAAEAGAPALLLLVGTLGVLAWSVVRHERHQAHVSEAHSAPQVSPLNNAIGGARFALQDTRVLRAGLAGAIAAGLARNLVDSDWFIFACLFTFWAVVGLMLALAASVPAGKDAAGRVRQRGYHTGILALSIIVLTLRVGGAWSANSANWSLLEGVPDEEGYLRALRWEPLNGDHYLSLGMLYLGWARAGDTDKAQDAEHALRRAVQLMPLSKTWYHLGNLYRDVLGDGAQAAVAYRRALEWDPHALRVMVELGRTLEQQGRLQEAEAVYRRMLSIESSVYNQIRAVPEIPEVDYAFAYAGLARIAKAQGKPEGEVRERYARALQILDADRAAREDNPMAQAMPRATERERALESLRQECERALR